MSKKLEKVLQLFEHAQEWADISKALAQLKQALTTDAKLIKDDTQMKLQIAKRLAQSMNGALPSGVHAKCMEVYALTLASFNTPQDLQL